MIKQYTTGYFWKSGPAFGKTLLCASGTISGELYDYSELDDAPPGTIPPEFRMNARLAFIRRYLVIRFER